MRNVAESLGGTAHISPLLRKAAKLGLMSADDLLRLAVRRGCTHYAPPDYTPAGVRDPGRDQFSDLELAIALVSAAQIYEPQLMRCAAQLLGAPEIEPSDLARLARMERCEPVIRHIAEAGRRLDEEHGDFWAAVLRALPAPRGSVRPAVLPHPSRFVLESGWGKAGSAHGHARVWLRPQPTK